MVDVKSYWFLRGNIHSFSYLFLISTILNKILPWPTLHQELNTPSKREQSMAVPGEPVGDFYVHIVQGQSVDTDKLVTSTKLLKGQPSVIHFYDGGWGGCRPCAAQMEKWAKEYSGVRFLTVCVDVQGVAKQFAAMFHFNKVVNCHIPSKGYFPSGKLMRPCSEFSRVYNFN